MLKNHGKVLMAAVLLTLAASHPADAEGDTAPTTNRRATVALSFPQSKSQISCITTMNGSGLKVAQTRGKSVQSCIKDAHAGALFLTPTPDVDSCIAADRGGKVARAFDKTTRDETKRCTGSGEPDFAYTDANTVNILSAIAVGEMHDGAFGYPIDTAIAAATGDSAAVKCQTIVAAQLDKLLKSEVSGFNKCKKAGLKSGMIVGDTGLADCLDDLVDVGTKFGKNSVKAHAKAASAIAGACSPVPHAAVFPGDCSGAATTSDFAICINSRASCHACAIVTAIDGFSYSCDYFDDFTLNGTCGP